MPRRGLTRPAGGRACRCRGAWSEWPIVSWFSAGPPEDVLAASAACPGCFAPVELDGHLHVDGGVLEPLPVTRALDLGFATTYLDVTAGTATSGVRRHPPAPLRPRGPDPLLRGEPGGPHPDPVGLARSGQEVIVVPLAETSGLDLRDLSRSSALIDDSRACAGRFLEDRLRLSA